MEWLVYILLGWVIVQQIQLIVLFYNRKTQQKINFGFVETHREFLGIFRELPCVRRANNTPSNEEGNGSINPSEADTGLCHEVSRQK